MSSPSFRRILYCLLIILTSVFLLLPHNTLGTVSEKRDFSVTTKNPYVPSEELELILKAFTKKELIIEAAGWQALLRDKAIEIAKAEIAVKRQNKEIEKAVEIQEQTEKATEKLAQLEDKVDAAKATGDVGKIKETEEAAQEAQEIVSDINVMVDQAADAAQKTAEIRDKIDTRVKEGIKETVKAAQKAEAALDKVQESVTEANLDDKSSIRKAAGQAEEATHVAQQATAMVEEKVSTALGNAEKHVEKTALMEQTESTMEQLETAKRDEKVELLESVNTLREERTLIIDNFKAVVTELISKADESDSDTQAKIKDYQLYVHSVQGFNIDVSDTTSSWIAVKGWLLSDEGGFRFALNFLRFIGILATSWLLASVISRLISRALKITHNISHLMADFLQGAVRWIIVSIGVVMALAALEVSVAPLLAMMGAAGFIIALALQDSLSNFASGIMILFFRPFDVNDIIEAGGVSGKVTTVSLVSTTIMTVDNKKMVVPNNKIWQDVIINATNVRTRRVDMEFGAGYDDNIDEVQALLKEIVSDHPKVLRNPAPKIHLHVLADSSVNFICRPWVRSTDYWEVYWDITRAVKIRFDEAGISIPYPQQDVHLHVQQTSSMENETKDIT